MNIILSRIVAAVMVLLVLTCLGSFVFITFLQNQNEKLKNENKSLLEYNEISRDSIEYTKTKLNTEAAKVKVVSMELKTLRKVSEDQQLQFIKQFNSVNRRLDNLYAAAKFSATSSISIAAPIRDTLVVLPDFPEGLTKRYFEWRDEYNFLEGVLSKDSANINMICRIPVEGVVIEERDKWRLFGKERKWLPFGKKRIKAELTSPNRSARITDVKLYRVK